MKNVRPLNTARVQLAALCEALVPLPLLGHMLRIGQLASGKPVVYDGPDALLSGFGLERTATGALYTGQFRAGLRHGRGALSDSDAHGKRITFDGLWREGIREGRGVEFTPSRVHSVICVGVWENGSKHGAFHCSLNGRHGASRAEGWSHGVRLRERTARADGAAADAWSVEAGVGFDVSSSAEGRWKYHGDVTAGHVTGGVLTPHGFGYSLSSHVASAESGDGGESSAAKGTVGWSWSYYGGWRDGEQHGPGHLLFHDGSYFIGNLSSGVPRRGFFGLPNGSALHVDGTDTSMLTDVCKGPRPACEAC